MISWCCLGFQSNYLAEPGKRGIVILVGRDSSLRPEFVIQFRNMDMEMQLPVLPFPISLSTDIRIRYCPWCGANLEKHYRKVVDQLNRPDFRIELNNSES